MPHKRRALISGPGAWIGRDLQDDPSWIVRLDHAAIEEIDAALERVKCTQSSISYSDAFPLPLLGPKLAAIRDEVATGRGFVLIRGIPRDRYSDEDCERLYWGLASHFGTPVSQNSRGHLLGHVRDEGRVKADPNARLYQTRERMDFHTDVLPVDLLGLFCLRTAKSGGESKLVSALTIHNILLEERPDLLDVLYGSFHLDWRGEEPEGGQPFFTIPMFSEAADKVTARLVSILYYKSATRFGAEYAPTAIQLEALELVQQIANRPELMLSMDFQEGDIQLLNNHTILHARTAYEDVDDPAIQRHLLRMWIAVPDAYRRPLADSLADRYSWVQRGGIPVKQPAQQATLDYGPTGR